MKHNCGVPTVGWMCVFIVTVLMLTFLGACRSRVDKEAEDRQAQTRKGPAQISVENGQTVLALDASTQNRLGIELQTLTATATRNQVTATAVVLALQDLATFRSSYVATQTQLQKSHVAAEVARKEYTRLKTLFDENQNISEKSLQAAEGTLHANEADERAAQQELNLQASIARQEWGGVVAGWAVEDSLDFRRLLDQREVLAQVTMASGSTLAAPNRISIEVPGTPIEATLVSAFPKVDPRIQGRSFLYVAPDHPGLTPGMNLVARLFVGDPMHGAIVPMSAVVWSEGKAWVYHQTAPDRFTRRAIATDIPLENGFFVLKGLSPGDKLVTRGAQALLSEELLLHGQGGGTSDED